MGWSPLPCTLECAFSPESLRYSALEAALLIPSDTEPQIAEAIYITAMFAFFNRVADAFGIHPQGYPELNATTK
jgi:alkylhydroperoxidase family enzyme